MSAAGRGSAASCSHGGCCAALHVTKPVDAPPPAPQPNPTPAAAAAHIPAPPPGAPPPTVPIDARSRTGGSRGSLGSCPPRPAAATATTGDGELLDASAP